MIDLDTRRNPLQELADLLVIPVSPQPSYIPVKKKEVTKVEVYPGYYGRHDQARPTASVNDKFELVMPLSTDIGRLFKFMVNVEKNLSNFDGQATILSHRRSCNPGFVTTMDIKGAGLSNIIKKLVNMSEVEKVEEDPLAIHNLPSPSNKPGGLLTSNVNHNKRIHISLKETDVTRQELVPMLA